MERNRAYYRYARKRTICKKRDLLRRLGGDDLLDAWTHGNRGRLAKGKIHCSCWMCRRKSYDVLTRSSRKKEISAAQQFLEIGIQKKPKTKD